MDRESIYKSITVVSVEQALALPYCTYRLVQDGMRVVRVEAPPKGDPNRYVGIGLREEEGMCSYYLPVNGGKESITINLKTDQGRDILYDLIRKLKVDVFATNQMPQNYNTLGIEYETIRSIRSDIIWLGLTGYGPAVFEPAYDPVVQARAGLMELNGDPDSDPMCIGVPIVDMGAGESAYGQLMKALLEREVTGEGKRIDLSLFDCAVCWTATHLPLSMTYDVDVSRRGNTHQFFTPVSLFKTRDGYVYLGVGSDRQWKTLVGLSEFKHLDKPRYETNTGRMADGSSLIEAIGKVFAQKSTKESVSLIKGAGLVVGASRPLREVGEDSMVQKKLIKATDPKTKMQAVLGSPPVETPFLESGGYWLSFPPRLGEHNREILEQDLGYKPEKIKDLENRKVI
jgi:crotonobetainyl-CoA:carnitine CoA-transferase CaiB-like acyl-CoA transferase